VRLDDTIERWFTQLPDAHTITIRQLGSMGSGINSYSADPGFANRYRRIGADNRGAWWVQGAAPRGRRALANVSETSATRQRNVSGC
jgi:hypothetical protein